jgi:hypothetical protein
MGERALSSFYNATARFQRSLRPYKALQRARRLVVFSGEGFASGPITVPRRAAVTLAEQDRHKWIPNEL